MTAVSTLILNALIMTGEKAIGDSLDTNEQRYYQSRLNSMMDSWSNERMAIPFLSQTSFALTTGTGSYTIGVGATFNMTRPTKIVDPCFIRDTDNYDSPLQVINMEAYGRIVLKTADGSYPTFLAYDYGYSATSTATIYLWPEPSPALTLYINTLQTLSNFSTMTQNLQLPPGYQRAIETNFAIESAPGFIPISKELAKIAQESKAAIKTLNAPTPTSRLDYGLVGAGRSNILTGP